MSNLTQDYGWSSDAMLPSHGYLVPYVLDWLQRAGARRVLDLGAGNGYLCGELSKAGVDVVGMEYDAAGVSLARSTYPRIPFYQAGVEDSPEKLLAKEAPFDAVVSTEVIEHLFSPHLLPQYARAVLKPGGRLLVTTPYHGYLKNLVLAVAGKWDQHHASLWHGGHIKFWSRDTLGQLLREHGFEVTGFQGIGRAPYLWKSMAISARLK